MSHRTVFGLAWPIAISMLSYTAMAVVDSIFVGRLGTDALAAVGLATCVVHLVYAFPHGLLGGGRVVIARYFGASDAKRTSEAGWQVLALALGLSLLVVSLSPGSFALMGLFGASGQVLTLGDEYANLRLLGAPVSLGYLALSAWFQARGNTRWPMVATVLGNVTNVVLDPILIFGWLGLAPMGMTGAALATNLGLLVSVLVLAVVALREGTLGRFVGIRSTVLSEICAIGAPRGLQAWLDVASYAVFSALLVFSGEAHMAAHVVAVRIILVAFLPCHAVGEAVGVLVSQSIGSGRLIGATQAWQLGILQAGVYMALCMLPALLAPELLVAVFGAEGEVVTLVVSVLRLYAFVMILDGVLSVTRGALVGAGDTRFLFVETAVNAWFIKTPVALVAVWWLGWGVMGAWLSICVEVAFGLAVCLWRIRSESWLVASQAKATATSAVAAG